MATGADHSGASAATLTLLRQLAEVSAIVNAAMRLVLEEFKLTESMAGVLWALDPNDPAPSMRELARRLGCDPSNVTLITDKLQRAGLVVRLPHPSDGRARVLALTEPGQGVRDRLLARLVAATPIPALSAREHDQLSQILVRLGANP